MARIGSYEAGQRLAEKLAHVCLPDDKDGWMVGCILHLARNGRLEGKSDLAIAAELNELLSADLDEDDVSALVAWAESWHAQIVH
jgi:hypothetical protein